MQTKHTVTSFLASHRSLRIFMAYSIPILTLLIVIAGGAVTASFAHAMSPCSNGDAVYMVKSGDTLGTIAYRYRTTYQRLQSYNHIANPNVIYVAEHICVPQGAKTTPVSLPVKTTTQGTIAHGSGNVFPYPYCTWWASLRYYQLHGYWIPWTTNANAYQWTQRAYNFGWRVSSTPHVGAIVDLQPYVQGAYGLGHVAVVERVLGNGYFVASNSNWGINPYSITYVQFHTGWGVTFIG